jgi:hypothetical protein
MAIVQKTIQLEVFVTVEVDEDAIGTDGVDDPSDLASTVCYGMQHMDEAGELFYGGTVKEYSASVISVEDTNHEYP